MHIFFFFFFFILFCDPRSRGWMNWARKKKNICPCCLTVPNLVNKVKRCERIRDRQTELRTAICVRTGHRLTDKQQTVSVPRVSPSRWVCEVRWISVRADRLCRIRSLCPSSVCASCALWRSSSGTRPSSERLARAFNTRHTMTAVPRTLITRHSGTRLQQQQQQLMQLARTEFSG